MVGDNKYISWVRNCCTQPFYVYASGNDFDACWMTPFCPIVTLPIWTSSHPPSVVATFRHLNCWPCLATVAVFDPCMTMLLNRGKGINPSELHWALCRELHDGSVTVWYDICRVQGLTEKIEYLYCGLIIVRAYRLPGYFYGSLAQPGRILGG